MTIEVAPKTKDGLNGNQNSREPSQSNKKSVAATKMQEGPANVMLNVELASERIQQGFGNLK